MKRDPFELCWSNVKRIENSIKFELENTKDIEASKKMLLNTVKFLSDYYFISISTEKRFKEIIERW